MASKTLNIATHQPPDNFCEMLRSGDQQWFDQLMDASNFQNLLSILYTHNKNNFRQDEHVQTDKDLFFNFLYDWMKRHKGSQELILTTGDFGFMYDFLKNHDLKPLSAHNNPNSDFQPIRYIFARDKGVSILCQLARQQLWNAVDGVLEDPKVATALKNHNDLDPLLTVLLKDNSYTEQFIERMSEQFAPKWVAMFLRHTIQLNNHDACAALLAHSSFQKWLDVSQFPEMYLKKDWVDGAQNFDTFVSFEKHFDTNMWKALVQHFAHSNIFTTDPRWEDYVIQTLNSHERIEFVRHMLNTDFSIHEKQEYDKGTSALNDEKYDIAKKIMNCLTVEDAVFWRDHPTVLDRYYRIEEHPVMVNALLTQETQHSGSTSFVRKM